QTFEKTSPRFGRSFEDVGTLAADSLVAGQEVLFAGAFVCFGGANCQLAVQNAIDISDWRHGELLPEPLPEHISSRQFCIGGVEVLSKCFQNQAASSQAQKRPRRTGCRFSFYLS